MNANSKLEPGSLCKIRSSSEYYSQKYGNKVIILLKFLKGTGKYNYDITDKINVCRANDTWLFYSIEKQIFAQLVPDCFKEYLKQEINNE